MTLDRTPSSNSCWLDFIDRASSLLQSDDGPECVSEQLGAFVSHYFEELEAEAACLHSKELNWVHNKVQVILPHLKPDLASRIRGIALDTLSPRKAPGLLRESPEAASVRAVKARFLGEIKAGLDRWVLDPGSTGKKVEAARRILKAFEEDSPSLSLTSLQLSSLPPTIGELWALKELSLFNNQLKELPPEIGKLKNLEKWVLSQNQLESLPPEIGNLRKLIKLNLGSNKLLSLPAEFAGLKALKELDLSNNVRLGFPAEIFEMRSLTTLNLRNNRVLAIPPEIRNLETLEVLCLTNNRLNSLPHEIGGLESLRSLQADENQLRELPLEIGGLEALTHLDLASNRLQNLPGTIGNLRHLKRVRLDNNHLETLPKEFGNLQALEWLSLLKNQLRSLPPEFGNLESLLELILAVNHLRTLPPEFGGLGALESVNLYHNELQTLPSQMGHLQSLRSLDLSSNQLESLPIEIGDLPNLSNLSIETNPPLNTLPLNLGNLPGITYLSISETGIPEEQLEAILAACQGKRNNLAAEDLPRHLELWKSIASFEKGKEVDLGFILKFPERSSTELSQCTLYDWLVRLEKARDFRKAQRPLARKVCKILASLKDHDGFKSVFFAQVSANLVNCQDRAAMALNEVYTSWKIESLAGNTDSSSLRTKVRLLMGLAKTFALRKELAERLAKHSAEMGESVEIFLYYETRLREPLGLVTAIEDMAYSNMGRRDWLPIEEIQEAVEARYLDELMDLSAFVELSDAHLPPTSSESPQKRPSDAEIYQEMERLEALCEQGEISSFDYQNAAKALMLSRETIDSDSAKREARRQWALNILSGIEGPGE